ncbi:right-handed parallel beta-helix repeat-containing protein [uncultured Treponema sp.]|uniref:pectate lyase family protein n=1 Tax=uncultured Treponema sp. TaxID=162155 RepID=UPI0015BE68CA|nr:right-handed parallel beta-helix repeat-containing protein [uncultured Treponema sp.]
MKLIKKLFAMLAASALLVSGFAGCSGISSETSATQDGYGTLTVNFASRAVEYGYSNIKLTYRAENSSTTNVAANWATTGDIKPVQIPVGTYIFKLSADVKITEGSMEETARMTGEQTATVKNGENTVVSFTLKRIDTSAGAGDGNIDTDNEGEVTNATVKIVKSEGWLNSAYVVFEQIDNAVYTVKADGVKIDDELIRYYDTYTYYETVEKSDLSVSYEKNTLSKVVRADALGLAAGEHTISVSIDGGKTESTATMTVLDHDRSGFAFSEGAVPGAYNLDGTLKDGTIVIYLTEENKKTVKATIGGTEYTGIAEITQAVKTKNTGSTPVDIRIIGKLTLDGLSCSDMSSAYALGVKEASYVTIEGVGDDATMAAGVAAFKSDYVEIANLGLMKWGGGKDGDGVSLKESTYVWVHNNDYYYGDAGSDADQAKGDGSMDLKDDSQHVTISYNHFVDSGKMSLCGMKSESGANYITYHHNWFDHSDSRHPRIRTMSVHVYNNYFDGNAKYGVGVTSGGNAFVEGNFFRNAHDPMLISLQGTDAEGEGTFSGEQGGQIKSYNNKFEQNNTNGVKFQFRTNKYDYTNNKELGEYKVITEKIGTANGDGTYTIYSWSYGEEFPSFISRTNAVDKNDQTDTKRYYQISSGKEGFVLSVPAGTVKVVVNAKVGSSTATSATLKAGSASKEISGDYADYELEVTSSSESKVSVSAAGASVNVKAIKVIASEQWETTYSVGADMSDIDAYEVDERSETVPETVKSKSGSYTYSNFDTDLGDRGLGLKNLPTDPDLAKAYVLKFAGRHNPDFAWAFVNSVDDASYALNEALNSALVAHKTGLTKIGN